MINKFICWLFGHNTDSHYDHSDYSLTVFCTRCECNAKINGDPNGIS